MFQKIGFIGTGTMGSAVALAVSKSGLAPHIWLSNRSIQKAEALSASIPGSQVSSNRQIAETCDLIFLGVKPQMMAGVLSDLQEILKGRKDSFTLVSMAAGLSCSRIRSLSGTDCPVIRMMPNTPAAIGMGVVQYCGLDANEAKLQDFAALLAPAGLVDLIEEHLMDAASCVSGCGPAFAYLFIEALADGGVACGLPRDKALRYAAQMLKGSAQMVLSTGDHPGKLKDAVCSPAGTTIQGVRALEQQGFRAAAMEAVIQAYEKTKSLG